MPEINWYPGHMAKSRRLLLEQLRAVDAVIELCDARAPMATRNPDLDALCRGKARILVLNKADLAADADTQRWMEFFRRRQLECVKFNSNGGKTREIMDYIERATRPVVERMARRGAQKTVRLMVIGIPNVGKSTFINRIHGKKIAAASDRPGVTRANQWVKVSPYLELLDTPGMLWPKLDNQQSARVLAYLGSINDQALDTEKLAGQLLSRLCVAAPEMTRQRYKLPEDTADLPAEALLEAACKGRGWLLSGGRYDLDRASRLILDEYRAGKIGRITLEDARKF